MSALEEVPLERKRAAQVSAPADDAEKHRFRSGLGGCLWVSGVRMDIANDCSQLASQVASLTVQGLLDLNKLIRKAKQHSSLCLTFRKLQGPLEEQVVAAIGDAEAAPATDAHSRATVAPCLTCRHTTSRLRAIAWSA